MLVFRVGIVSWVFVCDVNVECGREVFDFDWCISVRFVVNMEDYLVRD